MNKLIEKPISIINRQGIYLQGILTSDSETKACVIMCYPFAEERKNCQRVYVSLARKLAENHIASIRYDYSGCGNSEGDFSDCDLRTWIDDTLCVLAEAGKNGYSPIMIMGLQLGANIALAAIKKGKLACKALLWNIISNLDEYFKTEKKRNNLCNMLILKPKDHKILKDSNLFNFIGYAINTSLLNDFREGMKIDIAQLLKEPNIALGFTSNDLNLCTKEECHRNHHPIILTATKPFWNISDVHDVHEFIDTSLAHFKSV